MTTVVMKKYCTKISCERLWIITQDKEVLSCDFGPRNGAENASDIVECLELFFDKEFI